METSENQRGMLDYLISLLDDANNFSWDGAKASHAILMCHMEQGEIKDSTKTDKIDRIRRANAQRHTYYTNNCQQHSSAKKFNVKAIKSMPCQFFNQGSCVQQKSHETHVTLYKHICASCFTIGGETIFSSRNRMQ